MTEPQSAAEPGDGSDRPRQACAGGIVLSPDGRLLMIQRGQPPSIGQWSVPGGRCRPGESAEQACVREVAEETGLVVRVVRLAGRVERDGPGQVVYVIDDFVCELVGPAGVAPGAGEGSGMVLGSVDRPKPDPASPAPVAGDDAADARWISRAELADIDVVPLLVECLAEWDVLPR